MKDKKIKIARIVSEKFPVPPVKGGAIQTSVYYSSLILKEKFDITIFTRPVDAQKHDPLKYEPIYYSKVEKVAEKLLKIKIFEKFFPFRFILKALGVYMYVKKCAIKIKESKYDIVLIHNNPGFVPIIKKYNPDVKIILSMHNLHFTRGKYVKLLKWYYEKAVEKSELIIGISGLIIEEIIKKYPKAKRKAKVVYHGIKIDRFYKREDLKNIETLKKYNLSKDKITILFAARLVKVKGLHILLDAIEYFENKNFQLVVAGSPNFAKKTSLTQYEKIIYKKAENYRDYVKFLGYLKQDELALLYSASDIYVLPTIQPFEGCPQSLLEAMASECCVIGDFPELIKDGENGILIKSGDSKLLASGINFAMRDEENRLKMGKNARKTVENYFTIEKYSQRLEKIFLEIA